MRTMRSGATRVARMAICVGCLLLPAGVARGADVGFRDYQRRDREEFNRFVRGKDADSGANADMDSTARPRSIAAAADAEQAVEPSAEAQRLDLTNGISILIPGGALEQAAVFRTRMVTNEAALLYGDDARPLGGAEIDVQPPAAVRMPFSVVLPYAATGLNPRYSASEQLLVQHQRVTNGVWRPVPFAVTPGQTGPGRTVEATIRAPGMLRCVSMAFERTPREGGGTDERGRGIGPPLLSVPGVVIVGSVIISPFVGHYFYEWTLLDLHTSAHFRVLYDADALKVKPQVGASGWPAAAGAGSPVSFVQSLTDYGEVAWDAYAKAGFTMPSAPVTVKLDPTYYKDRPDPGFYEWRWNRIYLRTDKFLVKDKHRTLKHRIAHELFHACQDSVLGLVRESTRLKFLAYLESTAEYASCRIPWVLDGEMGHGNSALNPKLLEYPFGATGILPGEGTEVEYDKGYWIEYFCKTGVTITGLCAAVSAHAGDEDPFRGGLDDCLRALPKPSSLGEVYRRLAAFYLFADAVPQRFGDACTESGVCTDLPTKPDTFAPTGWSTTLGTGLTAKVFMMAAPTDMEGQARLQVRMTTLSGDGVVDVFKFSDDQRIPGTPDVGAPWHVGTLTKVGDVCAFIANARAQMYLVAVNTNAGLVAQVGVEVAVVSNVFESLRVTLDPKPGALVFIPGGGVPPYTFSWELVSGNAASTGTGFVIQASSFPVGTRLTYTLRDLLGNTAGNGCTMSTDGIWVNDAPDAGFLWGD